MTYDFDTIVPRRGTNCEKWDSMPNDRVLPMWVADMDFRTAQPIIDALRGRVEHGIFGYTHMPDAYYAAVCNWFARRHGWHIRPEDIIYTSGVVPAISAILKALTRPGDGVLVQGPVYNCFYSSIRNNGCLCISNPLVLEGNSYRMDYDDLEQKASDPRTRVLLLCNPHNPAGRVWTPEELKRAGDICQRHNVTVVSDEIHCELTMPGHTYTPFLSLGEEWTSRAIACVSPSKAFNIAGLQIANIVTPDPDLYQRINRAINDNEVCDVIPFGILATIAAYNEGEEWLAPCPTPRLPLRELYLHERLLPGAPAPIPARATGRHLPGLDGLPEHGHDFASIERPARGRSRPLPERRLHVRARG